MVSGCTDARTGRVTVTNVSTTTTETNAYETTFTNADLSGGSFTVTHDLNSSDVGVQVFDGSDLLIEPDLISVDSNSIISITLSSFAPLSGTWSIIVLKAGTADFAGAFTNSDLSSGVLIVNHNLNDEQVAVFVYDELGREISADEAEPITLNRVQLDLNSFTPFNGTGRTVVFSGV